MYSCINVMDRVRIWACFSLIQQTAIRSCSSPCFCTCLLFVNSNMRVILQCEFEITPPYPRPRRPQGVRSTDSEEAGRRPKRSPSKKVAGLSPRRQIVGELQELHRHHEERATECVLRHRYRTEKRHDQSPAKKFSCQRHLSKHDFHHRRRGLLFLLFSSQRWRGVEGRHLNRGRRGGFTFSRFGRLAGVFGADEVV